MTASSLTDALGLLRKTSISPAHSAVLAFLAYLEKISWGEAARLGGCKNTSQFKRDHGDRLLPHLQRRVGLTDDVLPAD